MTRYPFKLKRPIDRSDAACAVSRCKHPPAVVHLGTPLCDSHWFAYAEQEPEVSR